MLLLLLIISVIIVLYLTLIIRFIFGWHKTKRISKKSFLPKVSIIIAIRNEENNIDRLINNLQSQIYDTDKLDFILVNDHSTDKTRCKLEKLNLENLQILNLPDGKYGKKDAITMAVSIANGDIILSSDADCSFNRHWVKNMVGYFINNEVQLVSGPVMFKKESGIFQNLQSLEFISLIASGAAAIGINNPILCNGANMAYRKETFLKLNNFRNDNAASGDDVFLLHSIKASYPNSVVFANDLFAVVRTEGAQKFIDFLNQRKRWIAKSISYKDRYSIYVSYLVFIVNFICFFLFLMSFINSFFISIFIVFYILKFIIDLVFLSPILSFFKREDLIKWIFPFELLYSFYIILITTLALTNKFEWKGRTYKK